MEREKCAEGELTGWHILTFYSCAVGAGFAGGVSLAGVAGGVSLTGVTGGVSLTGVTGVTGAAAAGTGEAGVLWLRFKNTITTEMLSVLPSVYACYDAKVKKK